MIATVAAIGLGVLAWSFAEYCIHRWLGHVSPKNLFGREHTAHHSRGNYFAPSWKKAVAAAVAAGLLLGPALALAPAAIAIGFVVGFVGFYLVYEIFHRLEHVFAGLSPYGAWARRHHFYHHFHDPNANFGVTSPLWDIVFATRVRPSVIDVPERLQMAWLCDETTGDVRTHLKTHYRLRRLNQRSAP